MAHAVPAVGSRSHPGFRASRQRPLNPEMFGPSMYPHIPKGALEGSSDPDKIWKESDGARGLAAHDLRFSQTVDGGAYARSAGPLRYQPDFGAAPEHFGRYQALTLFNGDFVNRQARYFAERLRREAGSDPERQVDLAYRLALARPPKPPRSPQWWIFLARTPGTNVPRDFNLNEFAYVD